MPPTVRAFRHPNFRRYYIGNAVSLLGMWVQQVALAWLTYRVTDSVAMLGIIAFLLRAPQLVVGPLAGVLIDRFDRRRFMIFLQFLLAAQSAVLAALTFADLIQPWVLIVLATTFGLTDSVDLPLRQALVPQLLDDRADISNAVALNASMFHSTRFVGPPIAGAFLTVTSEGWCFLANAGTFLVMAAFLATMAIAPSAGSKEKLAIALREGLVYARRNFPVGVILLGVAVVNVTASSFVVLLPIYAKDIFAGQADTLGFLLGVAGAGALIASAIVATRAQDENLLRMLPASWIACIIGLAMLSFAKVLALAITAVFIVAFGVTACNVTSNALVQTLAPEALRGRLISVFYAIRIGLDALGGLAAGFVAAALGTPVTIALEAAVMVAACGWLATLFGRLHRGVAEEYRTQSLAKVEKS